jgi:hypothetical protein
MFALVIGVMHHDAETAPAGFRRPLQHLKVASGVPEGGDRPATDLLIDSDRLARASLARLGQKSSELLLHR